MNLTGPSPAPSSTPTGALGNYTLANLTIGGNYSVMPSKAALPPTSSGINTLDVIAVQRYYLTIGTLVCPECGDVTGNGRVDTSDVVAIQRFFLGQPFGTANTGQYKFTPVSLPYPAIATDQINQDYSTCVMGDVAANYVHRPVGGPSPDAEGEGEVASTVAAVSLPNGAVDASVTNFTAQVTTAAIDSASKLVGFQGDFTFDERVITSQDEPAQGAGLTANNWNVSGNVLPVLAGAGPIRTLRISAYSTDLTPLSGSGTLFELRMTRVSNAAQGTQLIWAAAPDQFIFIDADLKTQKPGYTASGGVTTGTAAPLRTKAQTPIPPSASALRPRAQGRVALRQAQSLEFVETAQGRVAQVPSLSNGKSQTDPQHPALTPLDVIDPDGADEATFAEANGVLFALFQRTTPRESWQRIRLE